MSRHRNWFITCNNYTEHEKELALTHQAKYILVADEVGDSGTPHLHLYIEYANNKTFSSVKKLFPRSNIQVAKGSAADNKNYLSKCKLIREEGAPKQQQGARTDIVAVKDMIKEGSTLRDVIEISTSYQSIKIAEKLVVYYEPKRDWLPDVRWYYGPTGTGKTRTAYDELKALYGDVYFAMDTVNWWQGYDAHQGVIIDDIRKDFCKFHVLLRLLDRYPYQVETKGGSRQLVARTMIITCPVPPQELYDTREDIDQLLRRVSIVKKFSL
jgi:hypothetical protein